MCRFEHCQLCFNAQPAANSMNWTRCIDELDADYRGFVRVICENRCKIEFHPFCWKERKSRCNVKNDKDYLVMVCDTPDCNGQINEIWKFGETRQFKPIILRRQDYQPRSRLSSQCSGGKPDSDYESNDEPETESKNVSVLDLLKSAAKKEMEMEEMIKSLNEDKDKLLDQLKQARNEAKAATESYQHLEDMFAKQEEKMNQLALMNKAEKEKNKQLQMDIKQKSDKYEKKEKEINAKCNKIVIDMCKNIGSKYLNDNPSYSRFVDFLENNGSTAMYNIQEAFRKADQLSPLEKLIEELVKRFPDQSRDNICHLVLEIKKNQNLKNININRIIIEMNKLIKNSEIDEECPICMNIIKECHDKYVLPCCGKETCKTCITGWQKTNRDCPFCRRYIVVLDEDFPKLA